MSRIICKSIKICFKECLSDSIILPLVSIFLSIFPAVILYTYNCLISNLDVLHTAVLLILCYCFLCALQKSIYNYYNHYYLNYVSLLRFEKKMKHSFFGICSQLNLEDYFIPEIVNETRRAQNASINIFRVYQIIVEIVATVIGIFLTGGIVFSIHSSLILFLILTTISPIADNIYQIIQKKYLLYENTQKQKEEDEYIKFLTKPENLKEIKVLKCFSFVFNKWLKSHESIMSVQQKTQTKILIVSVIFSLIRIGGTVGAYWNITGLFATQQIDLAEFSMAILTFSQIKQLFNQLFPLFGNLSEFSIMVRPYFDFLDRTCKKNTTKPMSGKPIFEQTISRNIVLKDISYKYPNAASLALKNINLTIRSGDFISIVGENGSGKTTLTKILLGLLNPTSGCLQFKPYESNMPNQTDNSISNISYIPQVFNCYCVSVKNNILFGKSAKKDRLQQSLTDIGLTELEDRIDDLYGLEFGGIELSGGQKQRIAILRAIYKEANMFIFDEPTSAIDPLQESLIYHALLDVSKGKTSIMVSHRLALTRQSDLIVVLKDGEIIEMGKHEELLNKNGEYATMWKAQSELYLL